MILRQTRLYLLCLTAGSCAVLAAGCSRQSADEDTAYSAKAEVTLTRVARADISETLSLNGTASALPNEDVRVSALVPGRVAELNVAEGDRVKAGEILARL